MEVQNSIKSEKDNKDTDLTTSSTPNITGEKYNKLLEAVKQGKKANKLLKMFSTTNLTDILQVYKWWEEEVNDEEAEVKWKNLVHNGVLFAPKYEPHGVKIKYKVKIKIILIFRAKK